MSNSKKKLQKKLAILEGRVVPSITSVPKTQEERKVFWSEIMDTAEKTSDALKASELLGKANADFVERKRFENDPDNPLEWTITIVDPKKQDGDKDVAGS
jgi:hypothetical protein